MCSGYSDHLVLGNCSMVKTTRFRIQSSISSQFFLHTLTLQWPYCDCKQACMQVNNNLIWYTHIFSFTFLSLSAVVVRWRRPPSPPASLWHLSPARSGQLSSYDGIRCIHVISVRHGQKITRQSCPLSTSCLSKDRKLCSPFRNNEATLE